MLHFPNQIALRSRPSRLDVSRPMIEAPESRIGFLCQVQQPFSRSFAAQSSDRGREKAVHLAFLIDLNLLLLRSLHNKIICVCLVDSEVKHGSSDIHVCTFMMKWHGVVYISARLIQPTLILICVLSQMHSSARITNPGVACVQIRADGKILATAGWDNNVRVFVWKKLKPLAVLQHHTDMVNTVAFSDHQDPPQRLLAAGSKDQRIAVWSIYSESWGRVGKTEALFTFSIKLIVANYSDFIYILEPWC